MKFWLSIYFWWENYFNCGLCSESVSFVFQRLLKQKRQGKPTCWSEHQLCILLSSTSWVPGRCSEEEDDVVGSSSLETVMFCFWRKLWGYSSQACGWGWRIPLEYHNLGMAHQYTEKVKNSTCNAPQHSREYSRSHVKVKSLPVPLCVLLQVVFFSRLPTWKIALPWQPISAWATEIFKTHWKPLLISGHLIQLLCFVFNCEGFFPWAILFGDLYYCL